MTNWYTGNHGVHAGGNCSGYGLDRYSDSFIRTLKTLGIEHDCNLSGQRVMESLIHQVIAVIAPQVEYTYFHSSNA